MKFGGSVEVHGNIPVRSLTLVGEAAVHARVVDLLREGFGIGDTAAHRPGPTVHGSIARIHEVVHGHKIPGHLWKLGVTPAPNRASEGSPLEPLFRSPR